MALLLAAVPALAQLDVPNGQREALDASLSDFKERLAPAKIDVEPIDEIFGRLALVPQGNFTRISRPDKDGRVELLSITLNEVEGPAQEGEMGDEGGGIVVRDLLYRRYFTHLEGVSQRIVPAPNGETAIDEWKYIIGFAGTIRSVTHNVMIGKMKDAGNLAVDKARSKSYRLSPRDPAVIERWKRMQERFLKMGPGIEV